MIAKVIEKTHDVCCYEFNGKKRYIVEKTKKSTGLDAIVMDAINQLKSREWSAVYNKLDTVYKGDFPAGLEKCIDKHTV